MVLVGVVGVQGLRFIFFAELLGSALWDRGAHFSGLEAPPEPHRILRRLFGCGFGQVVIRTVKMSGRAGSRVGWAFLAAPAPSSGGEAGSWPWPATL